MTDGHLISLENQDRSKWNTKLIEAGNNYLNKAAFGDIISTYHLEAAIAYTHCTARDYNSTDWKTILNYYDILLQKHKDPIVALNRCIALMECGDLTEALDHLGKLKSEKSMIKYYLYYATEGEILSRLGQKEKAISALEKAQNLTLSVREKQFLMDKISLIQNS